MRQNCICKSHTIRNVFLYRIMGFVIRHRHILYSSAILIETRREQIIKNPKKNPELQFHTLAGLIQNIWSIIIEKCVW